MPHQTSYHDATEQSLVHLSLWHGFQLLFLTEWLYLDPHF